MSDEQNETLDAASEDVEQPVKKNQKPKEPPVTFREFNVRNKDKNQTNF
jgi:hypothetical protein